MKEREVTLNYVKKDTGEVYILVEDVLNIIREISRSNTPYTLSAEYAEQIEKRIP